MQSQCGSKCEPFGNQMCRICFATECNMYWMTSCNELNEAYECLTGISTAEEGQLPRHVCGACADRLLDCDRFRRTSLRAHAVLLDVAGRHGRVTAELVRSVMKTHDPFRHDSRSKPTDDRCGLDNKEIDVVQKITDGQCDIKPKNVDMCQNNDVKSEIDDVIDQNSTNNKDDTNDVEVDIKKEDDIDNQMRFNNGSFRTDQDIVESDVAAGKCNIVNDDNHADDVLAECHPSQEVEEEAERVTKTQQDVHEMKTDDQQPPEAAGPSTGDVFCSCDICIKEFKRKKYNLAQYRVHYEIKPYSCVACNKAFRYKSQLRKHVRIHSDVKPYSCVICKKAFKCNSILQAHLRVHSAVKPYSCPICKKAFKSKKNLHEHSRIHSDVKPHSCDVCKKAFKFKNNLQQHIRIHSDEKPYSCEICKKDFKSNKNLQEHSKIHSDVKPYSCDVCKKAFKLKNILQSHFRIHSDMKPYSCDICKKAFKSNKDVQAHLKVHSDVKPHSCDICKKAFKSTNMLRSHLRVHSDVKPYSCDICEKAFKYKQLLQLHLKVHSKAKL